MKIFVKSQRIVKAWGMRHLTPSGPAMIRNPPASAFLPPHKEDVPAFAHDGNGKQGNMESDIIRLLPVVISMVLMPPLLV